MDSILLNNLFEAVRKEKECFALASLRSMQPNAEGLQTLQQYWGDALQDVKDKEAALGLLD